MNNMQKIYVGIDIGASYSKAAIINDQKKVIGQSIRKSGTNHIETSKSCLHDALILSGMDEKNIVHTIATGYGRKNVSFADGIKTEIGCHAKGCYFYFPKAITIIDIGGQDNKIIKLDAGGKRISFKMNRKCAAGTGAFLEEMSLRLDIPLQQMNDLASQSENMEELGSFCTVFSATEVLQKISQGKKVKDIIKGLFFSVIKRVLEMDSLSENVVMTGGVVAHNPYLVTMVGDHIGKKMLLPQYPQLTGAIGAALFALEL